MADKPAEKIDISFKGKKKTSSSPAVVSTHKRRIEPLKDKDNESIAAQTAKVSPKPEVEADKENLLDEDISNTVEERSASASLDGGFADDMKEESEESDQQEVDVSDQGMAPGASEVDAPTEADDEDTVYSGDEEFYSSKLDPKHTEDRHAHQEKVEKVKSPAPRMSPQYILVLATFVTVTLVGVFILHQLEEAREGAGIIFDWLP